MMYRMLYCTLLQSMAAPTHATRRVRGVCCHSNAHLEVSDRQGGITVPHVARVSTVPLHSVTLHYCAAQVRHIAAIFVNPPSRALPRQPPPSPPPSTVYAAVTSTTAIAITAVTSLSITSLTTASLSATFTSPPSWPPSPPPPCPPPPCPPPPCPPPPSPTLVTFCGVPSLVKRVLAWRMPQTCRLACRADQISHPQRQHLKWVRGRVK